MTNYERTAKWLEACGKKPGSEKDLSVQIGCHIEEFLEFLECIYIGDQSDFNSLTNSIDAIREIATSIKNDWVTASILEHKEIDALDALCDTEVTGNGIAYLAGFDKVTADKLVLDSNDDKLVDGKPVILPGGKIGKREGWTPPDLRGCV
jgi:predicted HAD superfamily Cof-like phosphohydrolase